MSAISICQTDALDVGAYEADAWAGLVFVLGPRRGCALRLAVEHHGQRVEPRDLFYLVREVGPHAPDGSYAHLAFDLTLPVPLTSATPIRQDAESERTLTWEWARLDDHSVALRLRAVRAMRVWLEGGAPWDWSAEWSAAADGLRGWSLPGMGLPKDRPPVAVRVVSEHVAACAVTHQANTTGVRASLQIDLVADRAVVLAASVDGDDSDRPDADSVAGALDRAAEAYARHRVHVDGAWDGLAASVANNIHWMVLLQPETGRRYVPAGRRWIFPHAAGGRDDWTIFAWDGFFNALLLSLESPALAREMLTSVLETQYPSGNIPNWRSRRSGTPDRSQPPVGAFVVLKLALRTGDRAFARDALPALERWHAWWRGGGDAETRDDRHAGGRQRGSGLFAWGSTLDAVPAWVPSWERSASHRQKAAWESGQDDLPNWDDVPWDDRSETLAMDCVDLSALLALDAECLAGLHDLAGDAGRAATYRVEHARLCALINARLWDDSRGLYADRFDDGRFSPRTAASNFLPLLAGAASAERASRALQTLLDPARFWGSWIVPTIDRRDPAFPDQQYWRGTIWPPTNFLLFEALRRVRADDAAATLAERSVALFLGDWRTHQVCRENFSSIDGSGGGQRHQSWGPLFSWIGLEQFADVTPWDGLRIGTTRVAQRSRIHRVSLAGRCWDIELAPDCTRVWCDKERWFEADGPVCLRHVEFTDRGWRGEVTTARDAHVTVAGRARMVVPAGCTRLDVA